MIGNPYIDLTREFNRGRCRAIVCSGQAVVLHRVAMMSKDGDWILREDEEAIAHVLEALGRRGARYRFGAPLDLREPLEAYLAASRSWADAWGNVESACGERPLREAHRIAVREAERHLPFDVPSMPEGSA